CAHTAGSLLSGKTREHCSVPAGSPARVRVANEPAVFRVASRMLMRSRSSNCARAAGEVCASAADPRTSWPSRLDDSPARRSCSPSASMTSSTRSGSVQPSGSGNVNVDSGTRHLLAESIKVADELAQLAAQDGELRRVTYEDVQGVQSLLHPIPA